MLLVLLFKRIFLLVLCSLLATSFTACTTYEPKVAKKQPYLSEDCELVTRRLNLTKFQIKGDPYGPACAVDPMQCVVIMVGSGIWTAGSLIVSGSITATGNMLHWMEYQGRCDSEDITEPLLDIPDANKVSS